VYASATVVPTLVAAASAAATVGSLLAYVYFARRSEAHAARDEALALAETRRQVIVDLRWRVRELEELLLDVQADLEREPPAVARALARIERRVDRPAA
jgi:hypothetical protein